MTAVHEVRIAFILRIIYAVLEIQVVCDVMPCWSLICYGRV